MLRKLLYFGSNKKSIPLLMPPGYRPTRIYAHQKRPFSRYNPWAYIRDFTVHGYCFHQSRVRHKGQFDDQSGDKRSFHFGKKYQEESFKMSL